MCVYARDGNPSSVVPCSLLSAAKDVKGQRSVCVCAYMRMCACGGGFECARTHTHICVCHSNSRDLVRYKLGRDVSHGELLWTMPNL